MPFLSLSKKAVIAFATIIVIASSFTPAQAGGGPAPMPPAYTLSWINPLSNHVGGSTEVYKMSSGGAYIVGTSYPIQGNAGNAVPIMIEPAIGMTAIDVPANPVNGLGGYGYCELDTVDKNGNAYGMATSAYQGFRPHPFGFSEAMGAKDFLGDPTNLNFGEIRAVNGYGIGAGYYDNQAAVYYRGKPTIIGGLNSFANGINDAGDVVGQIILNGTVVGAYWHNGMLITLTQGYYSTATGINASGMICGKTTSSAVIWDKAGNYPYYMGVIANYTLASGANAIADNSNVVGYSVKNWSTSRYPDEHATIMNLNAGPLDLNACVLNLSRSDVLLEAHDICSTANGGRTISEIILGEGIHNGRYLGFILSRTYFPIVGQPFYK